MMSSEVKMVFVRKENYFFTTQQTDDNTFCFVSHIEACFAHEPIIHDMNLLEKRVIKGIPLNSYSRLIFEELARKSHVCRSLGAAAVLNNLI